MTNGAAPTCGLFPYRKGVKSVGRDIDISRIVEMVYLDVAEHKLAGHPFDIRKYAPEFEAIHLFADRIEARGYAEIAVALREVLRCLFNLATLEYGGREWRENEKRLVAAAERIDRKKGGVEIYGLRFGCAFETNR